MSTAAGSSIAHRLCVAVHNSRSRGGGGSGGTGAQEQRIIVEQKHNKQQLSLAILRRPDAQIADDSNLREKQQLSLTPSSDVQVPLPPLVPIRAIQFGVISPDEVRRISVVNITKSRLFDCGAPCEDGLFDLRMGSTLRQFKCATCDLKFKDCPGHFGRIELASPVFHPNFLDTVVKVLNCVCLECSALLIPKTEQFVTQQLRTRGWKKRLRHVHEQLKGKKNKCCTGTPVAERYYVPLEQFRSGASGAASAEESFVAFGPEARSSSNRSSENVQSLECGCGHWQPKIVRSGIKVVAKWPEPPAANRGGANKEAAEEDDDDPDDDVDDKQPPAKRKKTAAAKSKRKPKKDDKTAADKDAEEPNNASALTTDEAPLNVSTHPPGGTTRDIPPEEVYAILQRISDYDIHLLGFDPLYGHPSWFVLSALLVPPPCTRPSIPTPHGKKSMAQDHLTFGLLQIVKMNNMLERQLTHDLSACVSHFKALLQYRVSTYLDNESKFVPKATLDSGRPLMSISQRFKTKKGRVRGNLMGKRVDFSARSVITPDANIALNELGVPFSVAMTTTYPERVYERNLAKMQRCVDLGPDEQYGAKFVIDEQGRSIDLRFKRDVQLQNGFIVERHLRDGDLVAFNRQPSLHKFSIQSHYVRLMPGSTFRLNLSATTPYNADFDGDEMNMHCPGSIEAVAELQQLMNVENNLVGAASNKPSMGLVQDSLLAARCFTMRNTFLDRAQVMQLLMTVPTVSFKAGFRLPQPCILRPRALWSGKQLVSLLLPQSLNLSATAPFMPEEEKETRDISTPSDTRVLIRGGTLLSGILEKGTLGNKHGSIVHIINNDIGAVEARVFLEEMQAMMHYYFAEIRGFSIGIGDMMASAETKKEVRNVLEKTRGTIATIVDDWERTKRAEKVGLGGGGAANGVNDVAKEKRKRDEGRFEAQVNRVLNQARDQAGRVASASLPVNGNNLKLIVTSGSKGSDINIAQMVGSVGQQNVDGQRVPCGLRDRALPHANWHDLKDIESRGFVSGSFVDGLTATEQFCHAMGGREGLIDTAVKTSRIGYIQRRLVKAMEDVSVTHDRTVRNSIGDVVQFVYGADDMDGAAFEWQEVPLLALSNADIEQRYSFSSSSSSSSLAFVGSARVRSALLDASSATSVAMRSEMQTLLYLRDVMRESLPTDDERWPLPVHVERLVRTAQQQFGCERATESDLDPLVALQQLETLRNNCVRMFDPIAARSAPFSSDNALSSPSKTINTRWERMHSSLIFFMMQVHGLLSPRRAMEHYHLSAAAFGWLVEQIERRLLQAKINAGEATGTLAAQSIGEPATQMTFNTFHYAGISEKNVTLGVPRLEEIIRVTRQVATPCMTLHLLYEPPSAALYADKQRRQQFDERLAVRAKGLAESLPSLTIQSLLCATRASPAEIFTQQSAPAHIGQLVDVWRATQHPLFAASAAATALGDAVPFFLCLNFSIVALHRRQISVSTIAAAIAAHFEGHVAVMFSDDNANSGYRSSDSGVSRPEEDDSVPIVLQMYKTELFDTLAALAADEKADAEKLNNEPAESAVSTVLEKAFANDDKKTLRLACEFDDAWRRAGIDGCMPLVLKQLEAEVLALPIDGVDGISGASARRQPCLLYDQNTGERVDAFAEWIVETDGSNLLDSFALEGVDHRLTTCNHPLEVYTALGIEAVRECLVRELRKVLTFDGSYVNYRHLSLLADVMTHGGSVMAINRFGLNRRQTGPLMRCTLEESVQMLMDAGIYSEFDPTTGPSERVALGRLVEHGTGTNFQVLKTKEATAAPLAPLSQPILATKPFVNRARISPFALVSREAQFESQKIGQAVVDSAAAPTALGGTKAQVLDAAVIGVNPFAASRAVIASNADDSTKKNDQILGQAVHEKMPGAKQSVERRIGNFIFRSPFANDNKTATTASSLSSSSSQQQTLSMIPRNPFAASTTGATSTSITQNMPILATAATTGTKRAQPSTNSISNGYVPSTPIRHSVKRVRIAASCVVGEEDDNDLDSNVGMAFSQITATADTRAFKPSTPVRNHQQ